MSLSTEQLEAITGLLLRSQPGSNPLPALRREILGISIAGCDAEDMRGETPFRRLPTCDLFLVNSARHCWSLVADPGDASGVIVATRGR
jgi:hypothetical protein